MLIKASAGGGGKGMRAVERAEDFAAALASCQREARNSFGDEAVLIEKYVTRPRHIEIQVFGDAHGNYLYLFERDCSVQRRHQKVLEEAPAPGMTEALRRRMGEAAVAAARAVKYVGAGTVEFIVEQRHGEMSSAARPPEGGTAPSGGSGRATAGSVGAMNFFFMEMNTRLQVEHPVTEAITGLDLVEWQLRVAAGEPLPLAQDDLRIDGHAIEARICAESPDNDFLPATGTLHVYRKPAAAAFERAPVRIDDGVREGDAIPPFYDSMIAKLIVHGTDRRDAIAKMREALNGFVIRGISSNIPFQAALLAHPKFVAGDFNTGFIAEHYAAGFRAEDVPHEDADFLVALAAYANRRSLERSAGITGQMSGHRFKVGEDFVVVKLDAEGRHQQQPVRVREFDPGNGSAVVETHGRSYEITSRWHLGAVRMSGTVDGRPFMAQVERGVGKSPIALRIQHDGSRLDAMVFNPRTAELHALMPFKAPPDMSRFLLSPMPGLLADVCVQPGQKVQAGERIAIIEAMKMENVLFAAADGVVGKVLAARGESLAVDQPIVEFE